MSVIPFLILGIQPNAWLAVLLGSFIRDRARPPDDQGSPRSVPGIGGKHVYRECRTGDPEPAVDPTVAQVLRIPGMVRYPLVLFFCLAGGGTAFTQYIRYHGHDRLWSCGLPGTENGFEGTPLILSFVFGPLYEINFRRSLLMSQDSFAVSFTRSIALGTMLRSLAVMMYPVCTQFRKRFTTA
jgi:putative tricarboxylic transport membrane protein